MVCPSNGKAAGGVLVSGVGEGRGREGGGKGRGGEGRGEGRGGEGEGGVESL